MTEFDNCFRKKLLVKTKASKDLAGKSLRRAKHFLDIVVKRISNKM